MEASLTEEYGENLSARLQVRLIDQSVEKTEAFVHQ